MYIGHASDLHGAYKRLDFMGQRFAVVTYEWVGETQREHFEPVVDKSMAEDTTILHVWELS